MSKILNLGEINKFFERYKLEKLSQEEIDYLNRPIAIKGNKCFHASMSLD